MKIFFVLFAVLAVQASARSVTEIDDIPDEIFEVFDPSDFDDLAVFEKFDGEVSANAERCLPYVQDAYTTAVEVRKIVDKGHELGKKFMEQLKACKAIVRPSEKIKCYEDLKKAAKAEAAPLIEAYMKIRPKMLEMMDKFDRCMAGQTEDVPASTDNQKCLPHIQEAYDTAVEVRRIVLKAQELVKKMKEGAKTCKAHIKPSDKIKCYQDLRKVALDEGKPLKDAYMKVRPRVKEVMDKFDECMA